jgi:hypothetical protein
MPRTSPRTLTKAYSPGIILHKSLAPTKHQARASSLILAMMTFVAEKWCRKTLALRSFQTSHEISMSKEAKALLCCPLRKAMFDHHTSTFGSLIQDSGGQSWIPHQARISFHTRKVKRHLYMRWSAVSWTWLHREQFHHHPGEKSSPWRKIRDSNLPSWFRMIAIFTSIDPRH